MRSTGEKICSSRAIGALWAGVKNQREGGKEGKANFVMEKQKGRGRPIIGMMQKNNSCWCFQSRKNALTGREEK